MAITNVAQLFQQEVSEKRRKRKFISDLSHFPPIKSIRSHLEAAANLKGEQADLKLLMKNQVMMKKMLKGSTSCLCHALFLSLRKTTLLPHRITLQGNMSLLFIQGPQHCIKPRLSIVVREEMMIIFLNLMTTKKMDLYLRETSCSIR